MYMEPQQEQQEEQQEAVGQREAETDVEEAEAEEAGETEDTQDKDNHGMGQHFFPSFAPVFSLGHSRPPQLFHQVRDDWIRLIPFPKRGVTLNILSGLVKITK